MISDFYMLFDAIEYLNPSAANVTCTRCPGFKCQNFANAQKIDKPKKKKKKTKERREFHSEICSFLLHFRENREKKERKKIFRK